MRGHGRSVQLVLLKLGQCVTVVFKMWAAGPLGGHQGALGGPQKAGGNIREKMPKIKKLNLINILDYYHIIKSVFNQ